MYEIGNYLKVKLPDNSTLIGRVHTASPLVLQPINTNNLITEFEIIEQISDEELRILLNAGKSSKKMYNELP